MIGPLPPLHRLLVIATVLCVGLLAGAWVALFTPLSLAAPAGAAVGALAGLLIGYLLVHQSPPHGQHGQHARR